MAVQFGAASARVGLELGVQAGGRGYELRTPGGVAGVAASPVVAPYATGRFDSSAVTVGGTGCAAGCAGAVAGQFYGPGASHAGVGYVIRPQDAGVIQGAAVLRKN
jgi:hypothetical protein